MKNRVYYFSCLRAIACIGVVLLHTYFCAVLQWNPGKSESVMSMMVRNCMLWAVPCFIMVTGALLLNPEKAITLKDIYGRYIRRALWALVLFSFIFALFDFALDGTMGFGKMLVNWAVNLFTGGSWLHMWYLYMLIGLYVLLPVFRAIVKNADDQTLKYTILVLFLFQSVLATIGFFLQNKTIAFYIPVSTVYPLYFFLGYAIHNDKIAISRKSALSMLICSAIGLLAVTYVGVQYSNQMLVQMSSSYAFILVVFQSVGIFALLKTQEEKAAADTKLNKVLYSIDACSFGIYLMHVLVIYTIYRALLINPYGTGSFFVLLLIAVIALGISWAVTWLLKHVPWIKTII